MTLTDQFTLISSPLAETQKSSAIAHANLPTNYQIVHTTEGRWRVKIERLAYDADFAVNLQRLLETNVYVSSVRLNQAASSLIIEYDPDKIIPSRLEESLQILMEEADRGDVHLAKSSTEDTSLNIYWDRLALPVISLALALIALPLELPPLLVGGVILVASFPAYTRALEGIEQEKQLTIDFLDALVISLNLFQGQFFPPSFMISMIEGGEVIRDATARSTERQTLDLLDSLGKYAWVEQDGVEVQIPLKDVQEGAVVVVYPGDLVPIDGKILRGQGLLDQNKLTGESVPVYRNVDDEVYASTLLVEGQLAVLVERTGKDTRAGLVVELIKSAPVYDTRMENYAAKFANAAVLPTLMIGGTVFAFTGDLARTTGLLTLDFGTGIRVSVPTAILSGLTYAARTGVYIRSGRAIEMLSRIDSVVFDKTGTLTQGKASVIGIEVTSDGIDEAEILCLAASAEQGLSHPVAHAIVQGAQERGITSKDCEEWDYRVGLGVVAQIEGRQILVGSSRLMTTENLDISASEQFKTGSISLAYVARDGVLIGVILYADPIRSESPGVISDLHDRRISTHMLTGDVQRVADAVAQELGMRPDEVHAQAFPERKVEVVQELKAQGKTVAFIGDGINDSAALAYADVSISFAAGSDIARETADIVLMDDDLSGLVHAIAISKEVMEIIYQNAWIVAIPNVGALAAGVLFALDPILAIIINNGSAIVAGLNGLRPAWGGEKKTYRTQI